MKPRRLHPVVALAAAAAIATGCGTTVSGADALQSQASGNDQLAAPTTGTTGDSSLTMSGTSPLAATPGQAGAPGVSAPVPTGSAAASGAASTGQPGAAPGQLTSSGPGVTANKIYVGLDYTTDADYFNQAAGVTDAATGDERAYAKAVVADINKHGGIAGRTLVPVWHEYDGTSTQSTEVQEQAACADYTQDHHVFAVMGVGLDNYNTCITKSGAVIIDDNLSILDEAAFARFPGLVELCCPSLDRLAAEQARALLDQHYFTPWDTTNGKSGTLPAKVGILTYDDSKFATPVDKILAPALRSAGYSVEVEHALFPKSSGDLASMSASIQSAELKFHSDGVTHVIIFEASGELSLFFMKDAQSQHYLPRYGVNSGNAMQLLIDGGEVAPSQLNGTLGFSYTAFNDIPESKNPDNGPYSNSTRKYCVRVMKANGITFPSANGEAVALLYCDELYYLKFAVEHAGPVINASTFVNAVDHSGTQFQAGFTLGTFLGPGRHDGASQAYYYGYSPGCKCMTYRGPRRTIP